jgi:nucleoside-diphosphate-sugar epimerase
MSNSKVVVLGINGHVGRAAAAAFVKEGWEVSGMGRTDREPLPGVRFIRGDAESVADMQRAIGDAGIVVNALNLPYHMWDKGRMEAQMGRVIEAMGTSGKTLLFPGNIYNYACDLREVTPDREQHPQTPRGAIRVRVEAAFEAAARRGEMQVIILRAGDFFGPDNRGDWFDQAMFRDIGKGRVATMGSAGVGHSWAYLPDLGRAFVALAAQRKSLGAFESFHFAGHFVTPAEMGAAIVAAAPRPLRVVPFNHLLLQLMGLASPMMREIARMRYLWVHPMELKDRRLADLLGPGFETPFREAIATTVAPFFEAAERQAA